MLLRIKTFHGSEFILKGVDLASCKTQDIKDGIGLHGNDDMDVTESSINILKLFQTDNGFASFCAHVI